MKYKIEAWQYKVMIIFGFLIGVKIGIIIGVIINL
jgi:uncharacterized membrane-anchored protein YhcB (DUF1043 family)